MAVAIRLMRFGKKGQPSYRVVVLDKRQKRDGAYIEKIGIYNPMSKPHVFEVNKERMEYWISRGAQLSEGMTKLLKKPAVKETKEKAKPAAKPAKAK